MSSNTYTWTAIGLGDWSDPSNWADVSTGQTPAATAPGSLDVALFGTGFIDNYTLSGQGTVKALILDNASLLGTNYTIYAGTVINEGDSFDGAFLDNGTIVAGTINGDVFPFGDSTIIANSVTALSLTSHDGSLIRTSSIAPSALLLIQWPFDDNAAGLVEIGSIDGTDTGPFVTTTSSADFVIDAGYTISSGMLDFHDYTQVGFYFNSSTPGTMVVNGALVASSIDLGGKANVEGMGPGDIIFFKSIVPNVVSGSGTIELLPQGHLYGDALVEGSLTLQMDGSALADLSGAYVSGLTLDLIGAGNTIILSNQFAAIPQTLATVEGFGNSDGLIVNGGSVGIINSSNGTVELALGGSTFSDLIFAGLSPADSSALTAVVLNATQTEITLDSNRISQVVPCFAEGTAIGTPDGVVAIETLCPGDFVITDRGEAQPIRWIYKRTLDCRRHAVPERVKPIRVGAHAFGFNRPARSLYLSPDHSVYVEGVLIPVRFLLNDTTIIQTDPISITYYHIELDRHEVVFAEGLPCETYLETGRRSAFENNDLVIDLHPDFEARVGMVWQNFAYAPLLGAEGQLDRVRTMLASQAAMLGYVLEASTTLDETPSDRLLKKPL